MLGAIASHAWDFGDGATSSAQHPSHVYREGGLYTVTLTVTGPTGTDQETKTNYLRVKGPRRRP